MGCNLDEMCTLFQFKDGQCQLLKQETGPGMGITSLTGMTDIWSVDIGKGTTAQNADKGKSISLYFTLSTFTTTDIPGQ